MFKLFLWLLWMIFGFPLRLLSLPIVIPIIYKQEKDHLNSFPIDKKDRFRWLYEETRTRVLIFLFLGGFVF